jgi:deoxyribonuclease V
LREKIKLTKLKKKIKLIGGADVSMNMFAKEGFAGFVVLDYDNLSLLDHSVVKDSISLPYIPGLLSFREIPMLIKAWEGLKTKPDVIVVDGVGIAHPRRMGIATHLGLILNVPTIGCAKSVLTGIYNEPANIPGSVSYLHDKFNKKELIGAAIRTKENVKPVFVSPGHLITLPESIKIIKHCIIKHRLPEPTRFAHNTVNEYRVRDNKSSKRKIKKSNNTKK